MATFFYCPIFSSFDPMQKRFSNITLLVFCGLLLVGIIITRRVDTAIETNELRKDAARDAKLQFEMHCFKNPIPLVDIDTTSWLRIEYVLPSFSSYAMDKRNGSWFIGDRATDKNATNKYIGKIAAAYANCTIAHANANVLKLPDYELTIITQESDTMLFRTYVVDTNYIVQDKNGHLYPGKDDSLFWRLYFGKQRFIPELAGQ